MVKIQSTSSSRQRQILDQFVVQLDVHLNQLKQGKVERMYEIRDFAELLHVHPRHLSNTIYKVAGKSPCAIFEEKLMSLSKELLISTKYSVSEIARQLTFDPSNFTKFFKRFAGITPRQFREAALNAAAIDG